MNKIIIAILTVLFIGYNIWIYFRYGILPSISNSFYMLKKDNKHIFFIAVMLILGILVILLAPINGAFFLAGSGAIFVAVAAKYKDKVTNTVHYFGASLLILASSIGVGLAFNNWVPIISTALVGAELLLLKDTIKNRIYWFEICSFVFIMWGLIGGIYF